MRDFKPKMPEQQAFRFAVLSSALAIMYRAMGITKTDTEIEGQAKAHLITGFAGIPTWAFFRAVTEAPRLNRESARWNNIPTEADFSEAYESLYLNTDAHRPDSGWYRKEWWKYEQTAWARQNGGVPVDAPYEFVKIPSVRKAWLSLDAAWKEGKRL